MFSDNIKKFAKLAFNFQSTTTQIDKARLTQTEQTSEESTTRERTEQA